MPTNKTTTKADEPTQVVEERPNSVPTHEDVGYPEEVYDNASPKPVIPPQGPLPWTQAAPACYSAYGADGKTVETQTAAIGPAPTTLAHGVEDKPEGRADLSVKLSDTDQLRMDAGRPPITPETVSGYGEAVVAEKQAQYNKDDPEGSIKAPDADAAKP